MLNIKLRKPIYGFGINDADYVTQPANGVRCPFFDRWHSMLRRCYSEKSLSLNKSYLNCFVLDEWKHFTGFKSWMEMQNWQGNCLDKDILVQGNKGYGSETCVFVPDYVNSFFSAVSKKRGALPLGVHIKKSLKTNPYIAQGIFDKKRVHLGCYMSSEDAHKVWQKWKLDTAYSNMLNYENDKSYDNRVHTKFLRVIEKLENEIIGGIETVEISY